MNTSFQLGQYQKAEAEAREKQAETCQRIIKTYGDLNNFLSAMPIRIINRTRDQDFEELYNFYSTLFTLPNESETLDGFARALELNEDENLINKHGKYEETWIYLRSPFENKIIAGINLCTYILREPISSRNNVAGTCHVNYLFVSVEYRGLGIAKFLHSEAENYAKYFCANSGSIWMICEQNAPELMTFEEYLKDNMSALVDQCDRLKWWLYLGYKRLNFNYIQPPLSPEMDHCSNMTLNLRTDSKEEVSSEIIAEHLKKFFCIAVLKGRDIDSVPLVRDQLELVKNLINIKLSGSVEYYEKLKIDIYNKKNLWRPTSKLFNI